MPKGGVGRKNPSTGGYKLHADGFLNIREDAPVRRRDQLLEEVSVDVADASKLDEAIAAMRDHKGAFLLNVNIDETDMIFPMTPGGNGVDEILLNESEYYKPV